MSAVRPLRIGFLAFSILFTLALLGTTPSGANAQRTGTCIVPDPDDPDCANSPDVVPPTAYISSPAAGALSSATLSYTIRYSDERELRGPTVKLNGTRIYPSVSYSGSPATSATATGTATLQSGSNTLWTEICDAANNCAQSSRVYTYDPTPPTVSINPTGGTFASASRPVTISWGDNEGLNFAERRIWLNGSDVTGQFTHSDATTSATSTATLTLRSGSNTLTARIRDAAGNQTSKSASYTWESKPTVSMTPTSGTSYSSRRVQVRVTYRDDGTLNRNSARITLANSRGTTNQSGYFTFSWPGQQFGEPLSGMAYDDGSVELEPGTNTLVAEICDTQGFCGTSSSYTYTFTVSYGVEITPQGTAVTRDVNEPSSVDFTVQNTGNYPATFDLAAVCAPGITCSGISSTSLQLNQGSTGTVRVDYTPGSFSGTKTVQLNATHRDHPATTGSGWINVTANDPTPQVRIVPGTRSGFRQDVAIEWCAQYPLDRSGMQVLLQHAGGTQDVTASFDFLNGRHGDSQIGSSGSCPTGFIHYYESIGTVTLQPGDNTLEARMTTGSYTGDDTHLFAGIDGQGPTATVLQPSGSFLRPGSYTVELGWCDNGTLSNASGKRSVTVQNTAFPEEPPQSVATDFDGAPTKAGCNDYAVSRSTAPVDFVVSGEHIVRGWIEDNAGNRSAEVSRTFTLDGIAPVITFSPLSGTTVADSVLDVTVTWTDDVKLNGDSRSLVLSNPNGWRQPIAASDPGDGKTGSSTVTLQLTPGNNTLTATIQDAAGNESTVSATYSFVVLGVAVTPDGAAATTAPGAAGSQTFTVTNTGNTTRSFRLLVSCTGELSGCSPDASFLSLAAGVSTPVTVDYTAGAANGSAQIRLTATAEADTTVSDDGWIDLSITGSSGGTDPSLLASTDFSDYPADQAPADWTERWKTSGSDWTVRTDVTGEVRGGAKLVQSVPGYGRKALSWDRLGTPSDVRLHTRVRMSRINAGWMAGLVVAGAGSEGAETGYRWSFGNYKGFWGLSLARYQNGVHTPLGNHAYEFQPNTFYHIVLEKQGTALRAKVWADSEPEPSQWQVEVTDDVLSSGWAGLTNYDTGTFEYDFVEAYDPSATGGSIVRAVAVTPDGEASTASPGSTGSLSFTVTNGGDTTERFLLDVSCTGEISGCNVDTPSALLDPDTPTAIRVSYTAGAAGGSGQVRLTATAEADATVSDEGWIDLSISAAGQIGTQEVAPDVSVGVANPGTSSARDLCLALNLGGGAGAECGDLRIVHALPTLRTLNKPRTPTLLYNSQHAHPYPLVAAHVALPADGKRPDRVEAVLMVNGTERNRQEWTGEQWTYVGDSRRIVIGFDALADPTGIYDYTLEVTNWYGTTAQRTTVSDKLVIVNRSQSPFGAGWWLAGLEQFDPSTGLWIGGDGSTRQFQQVNATDWVAENLDHPEVIRLTSESGDLFYVRHLPGGVEVWFDQTGKHVETRNRLGHRTKFAGWPVWRIDLPGGSTLRHYYLTYVKDAAGEPLRLSRVKARVDGNSGATRETEFGGSDRQITTITDPDGFPVQFSYVAGTQRIGTRTDKRGVTTTFAYDEAAKVREASLNMGENKDPIVTTFRSLDAQGMSPNATDVQEGYALLDGPRSEVTDHTRFYLNRWGAPNRIINALGHETKLFREDGRWPALVTRVEYPRLKDERQRVVTATYDERGNVLEQRELDPYGNGQDAPIRYEYTDTRWPDFVTRITPPEEDFTEIGYHADGNRAWMQDARGDSTRVSFDYYASGSEKGLLQQIRRPGDTPGQHETFTYDENNNLSAVTTPLGFTTEYEKDALGRDILIKSPINEAQTLKQEQVISYKTNTDLVESTETRAPAMNEVGPQTVRVEHTYDPDGNVLTTARSSSPDAANIGTITTRWEYDNAGRITKEYAPDGTPSDWSNNPVDETIYDLAGNPEAVITRRKDASGQPLTLTMRYDALNRLLERTLPAVTYDGYAGGVPERRPDIENNEPYSAVAILGDTEVFNYDAMGNLIVADNAHAQVRRDYYRNGLLRSETQAVRTLAPTEEGGNFTEHVYRLTYTYDLNGRRLTLQHPSQLAPSAEGRGGDLTSYSYHEQTGALETITDPLNNVFTYNYDARGALQSLAMPRAAIEGYGYDPDGRLDRHTVSDNTGFSRNTTFSYDARGRILTTVNTTGALDELTVHYSGMGHVISSDLVSYSRNQVGGTLRYNANETFTFDALGNRRSALSSTRTTLLDNGDSRAQTSSLSSEYEAGTGRLRFTIHGNDQKRDDVLYDPAGNIVFTTQGWINDTSESIEDRASYYDASGRLQRVDYRTVASMEASPVFTTYKRALEEYRYDALGRRVLVRAQRYCQGYSVVQECQQSLIRRTVWDAEQELYEIQMPSDDNFNPLFAVGGYEENDTAPVELPLVGDDFLDRNSFFGRVAYIHGAALDQPLSIIRINYAEQKYGGTHEVYQPFAIVPLWNSRGYADNGYFAETGGAYCPQGLDATYCVNLGFPLAWTVFGRADLEPYFWHGTLIEEKRDHSGQLYKRNRYYNPEQGRFTQEDPIGLAGGLNLYGYAGGDPVNFSDPFGLCKRPNGRGVGVCLEAFIQGSFFGVGDNRRASAYGGTYKTSIRFSIDPTSGAVTGLRRDIGSTAGKKGAGRLSVSSPTSDGNGGWNLTLSGSAINGEKVGAWIDFNIKVHVGADGTVTTAGGAHDGFPSYELWSYRNGSAPSLDYFHDQGFRLNFLRLFGDSDTSVPDRRR